LGHKSETREGKYCAEEYPFRIYKSAAFCRKKILGREDVSRARCVAGLSGLSCWPDRQTHQRNQTDYTNKTDEPYAALEAAFSKSS
jgi:hypothetical protein